MEEKINIAEILKDKPQGTKLYNLLYNIDVELDTIVTTGTKTIVWCTDKIDNNDVCHRFYSEFGTIEGFPDGLQILLPSKEMSDWSKFAWKKGDVLVSNDYGTEVIFYDWYDDTYTNFYGKHLLYSEDKNNIKYNDVFICITGKYTLEDKDAAQTYINTIEERLGGKLNRETLEIENTQPEFKDGDIVVYGKSVAICRKICKHTLFPYVSIDETYRLLFNDNPNVSQDECRFATEAEKQQLFSALEKEGKAWDSEKKQIVDLKQKWTPNPFDKVITRNAYDDIWTANIFSHINQYGEYVAIGCVGGYHYCLPYNDDTAHLIGTTDEWKGC